MTDKFAPLIDGGFLRIRLRFVLRAGGGAYAEFAAADIMGI
ncbi:MAG: hypothetical protein ACR2QC_10485 [Gammaproteobacteria bacterium]